MMPADAIRAEGYRLLKNRTTVFWSVLFLPILTLVMSTVVVAVTRMNEKRLAAANIDLPTPGGALNLGDSLMSAAADLANPGVLLFVLIGAATVYAGDYRWETWRLTSARNSRAALLTAKVVNVALLALAAMATLTLAKLVGDGIKALVYSRGVSFGLTGEEAGRMLAMTGLAWARVVQFTLIGLLTAVMSRSLLAALFVPLVVGVAQAVLPGMLMGFGLVPTGWTTQLLSPSQAFEVLRGALGGEATPSVILTPAVTGFVLWLLWPLAAALAWFSRQDLSKE